jgi:DNA-directed RNA polymerase subunit beta'
MIIIKDNEPRKFEYKFDLWRNILVKDGDKVKKWQKIVEGYINLGRLKQVAWVLSSQKYIVSDIKSIYSSQGQTVNSKHIELVVRQMFSRVRVIDKGDTEFFPWDIVDIIKFKKENDRLLSLWKRPWIGERLLLGITKISLYTESWLSAASFQETVRVLTESSVSGKIDKLKELKENVIIGRLIPAGQQYRRINGQELPTDDKEELYFDIHDEQVDISEGHIKEIEEEMLTESDF